MEAKKMGTPVIVLNMKSYAESAGRRGVELAKICEDVASKQGVNIAICPQQVELARIASLINIPCFAQHLSLIHI